MIILNYIILIYIIYQMIIELSHNFNLKFILTRYKCLKCISFWITLICTLNPFIAAYVSFGAQILDKLIDKYDII